MSRRAWHVRCPACRSAVGAVTQAGDVALNGDAVDVWHDDETDTLLWLACRDAVCDRAWTLTIRAGQAVTWRLGPRKVV